MRDSDHNQTNMRRDAAAAARVLASVHRPRPAPPVYLTPGAALVWAEVVHAVPVDHFDPGDYRSLAAYCEACALVQRLSAQLADEQPVVTDDDGVTKQNPFFRVYQSAVNSVQTFAVRLKLAPSTRTKDAAGDKRARRMMQAGGGSARTGLMFTPRAQSGNQGNGADDEEAESDEPDEQDLLS
jgi:phage terminase small subunit